MSRTATTDETQKKLPEGWRWVRLRETLSALESGSRPTGGAVGVESGVRSISAEQMTIHGTFDFAIKRFVPREFYEQMTRGHIQQGDILIVKDGATTGKTCFIDETFPFREAVVNEHVFICRTNQDQIQSLFLFYWLWGPQGQYEIRSSFQGAAIGGINQGFVDSVSIPIPPLAEQRRIAGLLREQMGLVETARVAAQARLEAIKALPAACLRQVFPQPGQPLPDGWRWVRLSEVVDVRDGTHDTPQYVDNGIPLVTSKNLRLEGIDFSNALFISKEDHDQIKKRSGVNTGDILFAMIGTIGNPVIVKTENPFSIKNVALFKFGNGLVLNEYFYYLLSSQAITIQLDKDSQGGIQKFVSLTVFRNLQIPLPPMPEQKRIAALLNEQMAAAQKAHAAAEEELLTINALPGALLRRAFNGEL